MEAFLARAGVSALASCLAFGSAHAQMPSQTQADPPAGQTAGPADVNPTPGAVTATPAADRAIGDIVVTAERRSQSIQRSSLAIEVFSGASLRDAGVNQARDLTKLSPGVLIGQGGAATQIYIRGVGDFTSTPITNPAVGGQCRWRLCRAFAVDRGQFLRSGADRSAQGAAGHAVWPQCQRRRGQFNHRQAKAGRALARPDDRGGQLPDDQGRRRDQFADWEHRRAARGVPDRPSAAAMPRRGWTMISTRARVCNSTGSRRATSMSA